MKSIFLSEQAAQIEYVYADDTVAALEKEAQLDKTVFCKADVMNNKEKFSDTEYIFSTWGMPKFTAEEIKQYFPALKCVFYAAGTVQPFARPFLECGVRVFSAWAANAIPVAEYTVSQIILANKGFFASAVLTKAKKREEAIALRRSMPCNYGVSVGIIGAGMIGKRVIEKLKAYSLKVLVFDPFLPDGKAEELGVTKCSLHTVFASCQTVSNHLANNSGTKGILDYECFKLMKKNAVFLNTGRGAQVREEDLVRILKERPDITAVLDVTYPEVPEENHEFYNLNNCFLTAHIAGSNGDEVHRMSEYMLKEYRTFTDNKPCKYEVSLKMLETMA